MCTEPEMPEDGNAPYYRLYDPYVSGHLPVVVCLRPFQEIGYSEERFLRDANGERYKFDTESEAKEKLSDIMEANYQRKVRPVIHCVDGGKCHHDCPDNRKETCFRRLYCGSFSDYTGVW